MHSELEDSMMISFMEFLEKRNIKYMVEYNDYTYGDAEYFKTKLSPPSVPPMQWESSQNKASKKMFDAIHAADWESLSVGDCMFFDVRKYGLEVSRENLIRARKAVGSRMRKIFGSGNYAAKTFGNQAVGIRLG